MRVNWERELENIGGGRRSKYKHSEVFEMFENTIRRSVWLKRVSRGGGENGKRLESSRARSCRAL